MANITTSDVLSIVIPSRSKRLAFAKSPTSVSKAKMLIPEAKFNQTFEAVVKREITDSQDMGKRNQIIRGVQRKEETYATLQIIEAGKLKPDKDDMVFEEFLLQNVQEASQEKYQLVETFGDTVGFFFGSRPKVYTYSGVLLNTYDYPWRDNWKSFYESKLRGTKCVETSRRAYLTYDFVIREGYILSMGMSDNSSLPNSLDFNFTMFITREANLNPQDKTKYSSVVKLENQANELISKASSVYGAIKENADSAWNSFNDVLGAKRLTYDLGVSGDDTELYKNNLA